MNTLTAQNKRDRLIHSAAELFHRRGLSATSLADIAKHADIPIGNVYYYFKAKEELAAAATALRKEQFLAAYAFIDENFNDPRQRLIEALRYFDAVREEYALYGCPVGKIILDVDVNKDNVGKIAAQIFMDFIAWAERQFAQLGHANDSRRYAMSLLAGIQGASILAKALQHPQAMSDELTRLAAWLEALPNKRISLGKIGLKAAAT